MSFFFLNLRRLQAKFKVPTGVLDKHRYVADMADNVKTETKMQGSIDRSKFTRCDNYDLKGDRNPTDKYVL